MTKPAVPKCCSCGRGLPLAEYSEGVRGRNRDGAVCGWACGYRLAMRVVVQAPWVLALLAPRLAIPVAGDEEQVNREREAASAKLPKKVVPQTKEELHHEYELLESALLVVGARVDTLREMLGIAGESRPTCRDVYCKCELHAPPSIERPRKKPSLVDAITEMRERLIAQGVNIDSSAILEVLRNEERDEEGAA